MLTQKEFITMSLDLNLFFLRIMKEHSFFLEIGFTPRDKKMAERAGDFRQKFEQLLLDATSLANGNVSENLLGSQATTQYTLEAERLTNFYTGIPFNFSLTRREEALQPAGIGSPGARLEDAVENLDRRAYQLTGELAAFKEQLLESVRSCKMFTVNYPLLIEHILREARHFMNCTCHACPPEPPTRPRADKSGGILEPADGRAREVYRRAPRPVRGGAYRDGRMFGREFDALTARPTGLQGGQ